VDLGLLLALLAAAAAGVVEARAEAAHVVLAWRAGSRGVPRTATALFIAALHARPRPHGAPCICEGMRRGDAAALGGPASSDAASRPLLPHSRGCSARMS